MCVFLSFFRKTFADRFLFVFSLVPSRSKVVFRDVFFAICFAKRFHFFRTVTSDYLIAIFRGTVNWKLDYERKKIQKNN